jgi:hypothetical protein
MDALTDLVVNQTTNKRWIHSVLVERERERMLSQAKRMPIISRGLARHVDWCPIATRVWRGKPYANFLDDCIYCQHCLHTGDNGDILCDGHLRNAPPGES